MNQLFFSILMFLGVVFIFSSFLNIKKIFLVDNSYRNFSSLLFFLNLFFLFGYLFFWLFKLRNNESILFNDIFIGTIFFFGSVFVFIVTYSFQKLIIKLKREWSKTESGINSLPIGYFIFDGEMIHANDMSVKYFSLEKNNYKHEELLNNNFGIEKLHEVHDLCLKEKKQVFVSDVEINGKFYDLKGTPIKDDFNKNENGVVVVVVDNTERFILERSREEFFSIASHELRTPLTAIRGNASMILDFFSTTINEDVKNMTKDMLDASVRLIKIVNDFLIIPKLEQGRFPTVIENINLKNLIEEITDSFSEIAQKKNLYLRFDENLSCKNCIVLSDKEKIRKIIKNLIGNAIDYTSVGGVTLTVVEKDNNASIFIKDTGVGISESAKKLLFRKFQQAQENIFTRPVSQGLGLGLYISKLLAESIGANLHLVESEEGRGSVFELKLPLSRIN